MKSTLLQLTIMASLAIFSTMTSDVYAQKTSMASMTVKATVVETASLHSLNEMIFSPFTSNDSGLQTSLSTKAEFVLSGSVGSEVNISLNASETLNDIDGNSIYFKPTVKIGNADVIVGNNLTTNANLLGQPTGFSGKTSVWIEGMISSENVMSQSSYNGNYIVSISYN
jgi:hypothetical protein